METAQYYQQKQPGGALAEWPGTRVAHITREPPRFGTVIAVTDQGRLLVRFDDAEARPQSMALSQLVLLATRGRRS